ncbi:Glutamate decarboxylase 4 [Linum grandiflorum]
MKLEITANHAAKEGTKQAYVQNKIQRRPIRKRSKLDFLSNLDCLFHFLLINSKLTILNPFRFPLYKPIPSPLCHPHWHPKTPLFLLLTATQTSNPYNTKMVLSKMASESDISVHSTFASRYVRESLPRYKMPDNSIPKEAAFQIINDELMLDGKPRLNLASFVTTWMEPECDKLIMDALNKNYVDMDEYPVTTELQNRCVNMIAHLFNAPLGDSDAAVGVSTVGSSEAIMLAGLAFKRQWQNKRRALGLPVDKPNIVTGANVQVCWEKFARYFEVELKEVKLTEGYYVMDPEKAVEMVDENTICVAAILGSTLNGEFEDVKRLNDLLVEKNKLTGWDTPIHVDAASGGFIAPFLWPELEWDFRLPLVKSINVSGHKYGLVYAGVGWIIWRSKEDLPEELIFHINYLGADQPTFTLNFSKGSSQIIAQYYQLIRLGYEGYRNVMENCHGNAMVLKQGLEKTGRFDIVSKDIGVPLVAFSLKDSSRHDEFEIAEMLRRYGWIVPAYTMPADAQHITVLRVVIREDFSRTLAERLVLDIVKVMHDLDAMPAKISAKVAVVEEVEAVVVGGGGNGRVNGTLLKKTEIETQREITMYWKNFVASKKKNNKNTIC